jgi:hypothetical protein
MLPYHSFERSFYCIQALRAKEEAITNSLLGRWDEMALAHYPSLQYFADMLASEDYQAVNRKWRVPSLRDTLILCTSELGLDELGGVGAKL